MSFSSKASHVDAEGHENIRFSFAIITLSMKKLTLSYIEMPMGLISFPASGEGGSVVSLSILFAVAAAFSWVLVFVSI